MKQAFIAAEDDRFYEHPGVDWIAITRAHAGFASNGRQAQGGSTITMQVARNFFLSPEKTYERKLREIVLALKIERELSKDEILELYFKQNILRASVLWGWRCRQSLLWQSLGRVIAGADCDDRRSYQKHLPVQILFLIPRLRKIDVITCLRDAETGLHRGCSISNSG